MENGQLHDDKLFRAVHDRLSDYEAPANGADWDAMSRSLDALPKTSRFQLKFSLNSILVLVGVIGISVLGYALVSHSGKSSTPSNSQETAKQNTVLQNTNVAVNNTIPATTTSVNAVTPTSTNPTPEINGSANIPTQMAVAANNPDGSVKANKRNKNNLRFGDQIDPKKGFIYNTHENSNVATLPITDPNPNLFYDAVNGNVKRVGVKTDSTNTKPNMSHKSSSDSATGNNPNAGVPVDGNQQGFGGEVN